MAIGNSTTKRNGDAAGVDHVIEQIGPPPRVIPRGLYRSVRGWMHYMLMGCGVIFTVPAVLVPFLLFGMGDPWEEAAIRARNTAVQGEVIDARRTGTHFGSKHVYRVLIRYHPPQLPEPLEQPFYASGPLQAGQVVSCAYVPEDPRRATLATIETAGDLIAGSLVFLVVMLSLGPLGTWIAALVVWRRSAGRLAVLRDGEVARGTVTRTKKSLYHVGRKYFRWIYYRFNHPTEGETESRYLADPTHVEGLEAGSEVAVVHDSYSTRRSVPIFAAQLD